MLRISSRLLALLLCVATAATAHTYHATLSEMKVNPNSGQLEVIHRFFADDVADVLSDELDQQVRFADNLTAAQISLLQNYIDNHFKLYDAAGVQQPLQWVGAELDTHYLYLYQERVAAADFSGYQLQNSLLFGHQLQHQVNTVNLMLSQQARSLVFTPDTVRLPLLDTPQATAPTKQ